MGAQSRSKRNYRAEYKNYQGSPEQIHNRSLRNQARRELMADGRVQRGDGKDVDHRKPLIKGGSNDRSNLRVVSSGNNRSFARDKKARMR